jgi:hypothetical protein
VRLYVPIAPREAVDIGAIANGAYSEYREVPSLIASLRSKLPGAGSYSLHPYDYVGEQPLPEGRYTYRLGIDQGRLMLDLEATVPQD